MHIQLSLPAGKKQDNPQGTSCSDHSTRLTSQIVETEEDSRILSLKSKILRSLVELPPMPNIILKAREIMEDPGSSLKELAAVIEHDQAIVARVLALANSAYYGLSGMVSSIQHASILLGQKTLGELITIAASSRLLSQKLKGYQLNPGDLWKHSLAVALGSRIVAEKRNAECVEDAFIAGLLHDAGKIILDPYIVTAIRYHHSPLQSGNCELAFIVHLADFAAKEAGFKSDDTLPSSSSEIDPQTLSHLGFQKEELNHIIAEITESVEKLATEFQ
jgi:HD-like signal output (HDOD) protein